MFITGCNIKITVKITTKKYSKYKKPGVCLYIIHFFVMESARFSQISSTLISPMDFQWHSAHRLEFSVHRNGQTSSEKIGVVKKKHPLTSIGFCIFQLQLWVRVTHFCSLQYHYGCDKGQLYFGAGTTQHMGVCTAYGGPPTHIHQ